MLRVEYIYLENLYLIGTLFFALLSQSNLSGRCSTDSSPICAACQRQLRTSWYSSYVLRFHALNSMFPVEVCTLSASLSFPHHTTRYLYLISAYRFICTIAFFLVSRNYIGTCTSLRRGAGLDSTSSGELIFARGRININFKVSH